MKFSVIVPVFNREKTIANVIESVVTQSYTAWELLLIDDGSTDSTSEICKKYAAREEKIIYIYKENGGVSTARNCGLKAATGDYIVFLDSDNSFIPCTLEKLYKTIIS